MPKPKGVPKTGGRKKGTPNKATEGIKDLLAGLFDDAETKKRWLFFLNHRDIAYRWKAFELYNAYRFGKPVMPIQGAEDAPPIHIDISAIPRKRERA